MKAYLIYISNGIKDEVLSLKQQNQTGHTPLSLFSSISICNSCKMGGERVAKKHSN